MQIGSLVIKKTIQMLVCFVSFWSCGTDENDQAGTPSIQEGPSSGTPQSLVNPNEWRLHTSEDLCNERPFREELGGIELDTSVCSPITLVQPSLIDVPMGAQIRIVAWHSQLASADGSPATGQLSIGANGTMIWSVIRPIPSSATIFEEEVEIVDPINVGDPITLNVRNHGANQWTLLHLERL